MDAEVGLADVARDAVDREVVDRGLAWWRERSGERRFLWLHLYDPHTPYSPTAEGLAASGNDAYLGEVADVDRFLGRILDPLTGGEDPASGSVSAGTWWRPTVER